MVIIVPYWMEADGSDEMVHYGHCTLAHVATRLVGAKLQSRRMRENHIAFDDIFKCESMETTVTRSETKRTALDHLHHRLAYYNNTYTNHNPL